MEQVWCKWKRNVHCEARWIVDQVGGVLMAVQRQQGVQAPFIL